MNRSTIAAGVGGDAGWQALAWALEEATSTESHLEICHVCPADSPLAARTGTVPVGVLELADPPLARAVGAAKARLGGNRVTLSLHDGRVANALLRVGNRVDLLVLGAGGRTTHQVATEAQCPIVVVRTETNGHRGPFPGHVVVGVDSSRPSRTALELAFAYAAAHRRPLAAVHAIPLDTGDILLDEQIPRPAFGAATSAVAMLAAEVEPWTHEYPTVTVNRAVLADRPLPGLLRAAAGARLVVVGHRGHGPLTHPVLGSVARGVIDHATGPAVVTHMHDANVSVFDGGVGYRELLRKRA